MLRQIICLLWVAAISSGKQDETPVPVPLPSPPVERHPSNDDWGTTYVAIVVMTLIAFAALGVLVKRSFQLVPTGVMALRTLVGGRSDDDGYHVLANEEEADANGEMAVEDAQVLHMAQEQTAPEDAEHASEQRST
ncbi:hypothetical protein J3B02_003416 [Coemansia erecta]|uniref:Uncharacterized protein n=1 Tax=Coemansia asiatica TaxID=1052880 RepID=A0A9W7XQQ6_9FUNG|nr:hypothetical protein LPJ64_001401 [Coemansia asiatica]KAJ2852827.1 hypothetical protein J3B02_003416 [Coemansia erecta]KAJ2877879.1 hypothetical protein FB639_003587 [Coemansia asiatica]